MCGCAAVSVDGVSDLLFDRQETAKADRSGKVRCMIPPLPPPLKERLGSCVSIAAFEGIVKNNSGTFAAAPKSRCVQEDEAFCPRFEERIVAVFDKGRVKAASHALSDISGMVCAPPRSSTSGGKACVQIHYTDCSRRLLVVRFTRSSASEGVGHSSEDEAKFCESNTLSRFSILNVPMK